MATTVTLPRTALEWLGYKEQAEKTPISLLGIDSKINTQQTHSKRYFELPEGAEAADGNLLAVRTVHSFSCNDTEHLKFLSQCAALVKEHSAQLKSIDKKIAGGIVLGVVTSVLSFIPFVGALGLLGWGSAIYYMNQRALAYANYEESLKLLVCACNWSLGSIEDARAGEALAKKPEIREMMAVLYPVLTQEQVQHLIADEIEGIFVKEYVAYENRLSASSFFSRTADKAEDKIKLDDKIALSKKGTEFNRCIYGFNQGNAIDFLDALLSAIPDLYRIACHRWQQFKYDWTSGSAPESQQPDTCMATL